MLKHCPNHVNLDKKIKIKIKIDGSKHTSFAALEYMVT
jgi:hypothetical protein